MNNLLMGDNIFATTARNIAASINASHYPGYYLRDMGLNRAFRRKLGKLARRGKVTAFDIPHWVIMNYIAGRVA